MKLGLALGIACLGSVLSAETVTYAFEWKGEGGYTLTGAMQYESTALAGPMVMAGDVSCFVIEGTLDGAPIGRWALGMLNEETSWRLHFDPATGSFLADGQGVWMPQAWNMDGAGTDCGKDGFGFNIGSAAQDICIDGRLIYDSQVDPNRPFPTVKVDRFDFPADACTGPALLSMLR